MYKYQSNDGLCRSNNFSLIDGWNKIVAEREKKTKEFCDYLISIGVKALHPDDGGVVERKGFEHCYKSQAEKEVIKGE